jgi:hypothetical protein
MKIEIQFPARKFPEEPPHWEKTVVVDHEIFVEVNGGLVQHVTNLPPGIRVTVIDYDVEGSSDPVEISPINGEACCIARYP